jgi:hypothetical protein
VTRLFKVYLEAAGCRIQAMVLERTEEGRGGGRQEDAGDQHHDYQFHDRETM